MYSTFVKVREVMRCPFKSEAVASSSDVITMGVALITLSSKLISVSDVLV
jgi:hypothetical protein